MFGPPGHLYVYFSYGMHWCANVACAPAGTCGAVLIRALAPLTGIEGMYRERAKARRDLCSGPAKLCQALQIDGSHNGLDLDLSASGVEFRDDGGSANAGVSARIGLGPNKGRDFPWRFFIPGDPNVSASPR
jgi:DNA-3-methyladenine glycosylase